MTAELNLPAPPAGRSGWPWSGPGEPGLLAARTWPRITVVTPSFNQAEYLEATLRSVLRQGYPNLEYLVIDGGSTDGSVDIIRQYAPWLNDWVSEPDRGQSHAIEKGFARATGEIVAWLNSDDLYLPGTLVAVAEQFLAQPHAALVYGDAEHIAPDGGPRPDRPRAQAYDRRWLLEHSNLIPQPAAFIRREAFYAAGGLDESLYYVMDWDLWLRLERTGPMVFMAQRLAQMRIHPEAKTQAGGRRMHTELRRVIERHGGAGLPQAPRERLAEEQVSAAFAAFGAGDFARGREELAFLIENAPEWQGDAWRWAQLIAEQTWRSHRGSPLAPIEFARQVVRWLPPEAGPAGALERETLGLLHAALAFDHWRRGQPRAARHQAALAMGQSHRQLANRGLWSVCVRSWLRREAP